MPIRFQVDPDFYDHPKTIDASDAAVALWTRAGSYSTAKLLDGFVPETALALLSKVADEASAELVRRGLWKRVKGGFRFHQWDQRNLTRARVEETREYERDKKRRQRQQQVNGHVNGATVPSGHARDGPGTTAGVPPVFVSVSGSVLGSAVPAGQPPTKCQDHVRVAKPPPCGACAEARKAHDQWQADKRQRVALAAKCRVHRGQLAHNCALCRAEELSPP